MDYSQIKYDVVGRVARVSMNRPRVKNAQSRVLVEELDRAFARARDDREVRVVVLRGEGDSFSAGHDLGSAEQRADRDVRPDEPGLRGRYGGSWDRNIELTMRWRNLPKPTIAAVHGDCIFAGWMIASAMDVVFAADNTRFLPTNFQYFSVPWDLGVRRAKEVLFQSRFLTAAEGAEYGFVNRVVPLAGLDTEVMEYAESVAQNDPFQLRMIKLAVNQAQDAQGFTQHIYGAFGLHILSSIGESDPTADLPQIEGRRRPMVQRAIDNQRRAQERREGQS